MLIRIKWVLFCILSLYLGIHQHPVWAQRGSQNEQSRETGNTCHTRQREARQKQYMAMSFFDWTMGDQWKVTLREHWSSVRLYPQLFSGGRMSYLRYLCLFAYCGVQHILCYVFVLLFFVLCDMCYQFLWIVHFDCPFGPTRDVGVSLNIKIKYKTKPKRRTELQCSRRVTFHWSPIVQSKKDIAIYWQIGQKSQYLLGLKTHDFGRFVTNWSVENMTPNLTPHMLSLDVSSSLS
jgi:hypothetical protein